eukprot:SAG31_NODE_724_length_12555_cov_11.624277_6_plen_69_part_00
MPTIFVVICLLIYMSQKRTVGVVIAAGGADESSYSTVFVKLKSNLMFGVFLLYPASPFSFFLAPQVSC